MAEMASLNVVITAPLDNLNIQWQGYSDSLPTFIEETLKRVKSLNVKE